MDIREELIKYAKWYDRATQPEYAQTDEADLVQNVDSYLQTEGKNLVNVPVSGQLQPDDDPFTLDDSWFEEEDKREVGL